MPHRAWARSEQEVGFRPGAVRIKLCTALFASVATFVGGRLLWFRLEQVPRRAAARKPFALLLTSPDPDS